DRAHQLLGAAGVDHQAAADARAALGRRLVRLIFGRGRLLFFGRSLFILLLSRRGLASFRRGGVVLLRLGRRLVVRGAIFGGRRVVAGRLRGGRLVVIIVVTAAGCQQPGQGGGRHAGHRVAQQAPARQIPVIQCHRHSSPRRGAAPRILQS